MNGLPVDFAATLAAVLLLGAALRQLVRMP